MGEDHLHIEHRRPSGLRLKFMTPTLEAVEVTGGGISLAHVLQCMKKFFASYALSFEIPECNAQSSQLCYKGYNTLCGSKCVFCDNSIDNLRY